MKALAEAQEWPALEDAWLEALSQGSIDVAPLLEVAEIVALHDRRRAVELLILLAGELVGRRSWGDARSVLRQAVHLAPSNPDVRDVVHLLIKGQVGDARTAQRMVEFAGFDDRPLAEAWDRFEALHALRAGSYVLHDSWGAGKVIEFDTATEEVAIDFVGRPAHRMAWGMAIKALMPLPADHLLAMTVDRSAQLAALTPGDMLAIAVRSLGGDADPKDVKRLVEPIVGAGAWSSWWAAARGEAKEDPRFHLSLAKPMRIRVVEGDAAPPPDALSELRAAPLGELARLAARLGKNPSLRDGVHRVVRDRLPSLRRHPSQLVEALLVLGNLGAPEAVQEAVDVLATAADPAGTVLAIRSTDLRRQAMELLESRGDATATRRDLFLRSTNPADWEALCRRMSEEEKAELGWEVHRGLPARAPAYFWLVRKADEGFPLPGTAMDRAIRLVGLLDEAGGLVGPVTSYIAEGRMLQKAVEGSRDKAQSLLAFLGEARLPVSLKEEIRADVYTLFPELRPTHEIIYTTTEGLQAREAELRHLLKVELPHNKAALAEAKAHGDLRENFEYKAAKEQQDRILARIDEIQAELSRVRVLAPEKVDTSAVGPGCAVTVVGPDDVAHRIVIVGPWESDPEVGRFSYRAPVVQPLLGRKVGDVIPMDLPTAPGPFRIAAIASWTS